MAKLQLVCLILLFISPCRAQNKIVPGGVWPDQNGNHVQAHGGGIIKIKDTFYWFGEYRAKDNDSNYRYVGCYSSTNLTNWKFRNTVIKIKDPEQLGPKWVLERPKVFYNKKTDKFVMYMHIDNSNYKLARVGVAVRQGRW